MTRKFIIFSTIICSLLTQNCSITSVYNPVFEIIYLGNINGNLDACHCSDPPLGGLANISAVIREKRAENNQLIVVDGGDIFNSYSFPLLNNSIMQSYQIIRPDIIVPGDQEFSEGENFFKAFARSSKGLLLSNAGIKGLTTIVQKDYHIEGNKHISFTGFLEPGISDSNTFINYNITQYKNETGHLNSSDFNVLVYHGTEDYFNNNQNLFNGFNLILSAHMQSEIMDTTNVPFHINAFADGEVIFDIKILNNGQNYRIKAKKIIIQKASTPDAKIEQLIKEYNLKLDSL